MTEKLHRALEAVIPHVEEGSQIFVREGEVYHKFRVDDGKVAHMESHSHGHVERGRGPLGHGGRKAGRIR
jgi:hypothetical protein